jgi:hypothetical protein
VDEETTLGVTEGATDADPSVLVGPRVVRRDGEGRSSAKAGFVFE